LSSIAAGTVQGTVPHTPPLITHDSREYWTGGGVGELRIYRCDDCGFYIHPPVPVCRRCRSLRVSATPVSGRGRIRTFTVNYHPWTDDYSGPYTLALVQLDEQDDLCVTTNIVGCQIEQVRIGMPVAVEFLPCGDGWLPLFRATESAATNTPVLDPAVADDVTPVN
jgi:uncharacterized OB-fold protein